MAKITFKGKECQTSGELPKEHLRAPNFQLVDKNLKERSLEEFSGKRKILATVPSLDTGVCSMMTKHINEFAKKHPDFVFITISADLPFAQNRFCEQENVHNVHTFSLMGNQEFAKAYGLLITDGPLKGLLARSLVVLDEKNHVLYGELVDEITKEPNYHKAFEILQGHRKS